MWELELLSDFGLGSLGLQSEGRELSCSGVGIIDLSFLHNRPWDL